MTEQSTIDFLNKISGANLSLVKGQFNPYDAECDNYIVEIKNRREYYSEKLIEAMKLFKNFQMAQLRNKQFLYVVTDSRGIWVYNISKNMDTIINQGVVARECPKTTDFNKTEKITKYSFLLKEDYAKHFKND